LKQGLTGRRRQIEVGRDTQKTQHGIETILSNRIDGANQQVETLRKPSTGLKQVAAVIQIVVETSETQLGKTQHGLKRHSENPAELGRDTQKTQHGIETNRRVSQP